MTRCVAPPMLWVCSGEWDAVLAFCDWRFSGTTVLKCVKTFCLYVFCRGNFNMSVPGCLAIGIIL